MYDDWAFEAFDVAFKDAYGEPRLSGYTHSIQTRPI
jgi:hypothetical protein